MLVAYVFKKKKKKEVRGGAVAQAHHRRRGSTHTADAPPPIPRRTWPLPRLEASPSPNPAGRDGQVAASVNPDAQVAAARRSPKDGTNRWRPW